MEHRCSVRKPMEFQLMLYKHGLPVQSAVSRNLGLGGMLIDTGTTTWRKNEYLEVEFICAGGGPGMRVPAVVVHQSSRGAGLMFDGISAEQRRRLRAWLFSHDRSEKGASSLAVA
ncbi:PilZ domain-containing protein [Thiogranum longum]|uniref:PilZ domain-containing protein n=1 Tax=Thiogranum longum TaxID=1537524 RepID=A0A4R1HIC5_9GAMM|nr:PilZ domain-containing protein [Thiogranum longum]TCK19179.1 PilZ domain-containing protein [Thiogranum longum]